MASGDGERIVPTAIIERIVTHPDGSFGPFTEKSTLPVRLVVHHVGIVSVKRYGLRL
jgi:hypothetical protein